MRALFLSGTLAAAVSALNLPRQTLGGSTGPAPTNPVVVFNQSSFPLLTPEQALAALYQKAKASPSAVSILPQVPVPSDVSRVLASASATAAASAAAKAPAANAKIAAADAVARPAAAGAVNAAAAGTCSSPAIRYEWRNLPSQNKQQFVAAMHCLVTKSARSGLPGVRTRWDDLVALHQRMSDTIHNVGQFLPWHRYFLKMVEMELRSACGYTGPMTWWDETKDAGRFSSAPMATDQYFGRLTDGSPQCVNSGAFSGQRCNIGPGINNQNHCLSRGVNEKTSASITQTFVNTCGSYTKYTDMQNCVFFGPHAYGHNAIGGDMSDVNSSPNDPFFHLHHGFIDHQWRIWQNKDPNRKYAIGGNTRQNCGSSCQPTTLDYQLTSFGFYPAVSVRDVMDTTGSYLCYKYDY